MIHTPLVTSAVVLAVGWTAFSPAAEPRRLGHAPRAALRPAEGTRDRPPGREVVAARPGGAGLGRRAGQGPGRGGPVDGRLRRDDRLHGPRHRPGARGGPPARRRGRHAGDLFFGQWGER